jgi:ferredoxin
VIVGATPCDAASLVVLDQVFLSDPPDPFYARRRLKLTVIGLACSHPEPECFCTSVGLSPTSSKGCDIFLTPLNMELCDGFSVGPAYLAEVLTKKGRSLIKNVEAEWIKPSKPDQEACIYSLKSARDKGIRSEMLARRELAVNPNDLRGDFQNPVWEETGRICLGCGVCAFVCPTCTCYDLTEEREGECWSRCKNWDSCGFGYFTLHASGHNPRPTQLERYRQRVMHKFSYFVEQTGTTMCVGCGRCTKFCPVGVNIYDVRQRWQ